MKSEVHYEGVDGISELIAMSWPVSAELESLEHPNIQRLVAKANVARILDRMTNHLLRIRTTSAPARRAVTPVISGAVDCVSGEVCQAGKCVNVNE